MLMEGARFAEEKYSDSNLKYNECYKYAVIRNILYNNEKNIEFLVTYEPKMKYIIEWWKQLYGESEGKEGKGTSLPRKHCCLCCSKMISP